MVEKDPFIQKFLFYFIGGFDGIICMLIRFLGEGLIIRKLRRYSKKILDQTGRRTSSVVKSPWKNWKYRSELISISKSLQSAYFNQKFFTQKAQNENQNFSFKNLHQNEPINFNYSNLKQELCDKNDKPTKNSDFQIRKKCS